MFNHDFIENSLRVKNSAAFTSKVLEFNGFSTDSRTIEPDQCFIALTGDNFDGHDFLKPCYEKGVRNFIIENRYKNLAKKILPEGNIFCVHNTVKALGIMAKTYRNSIFASVSAITGSSGKTTAREILVRILSQKYNIHTAKKNFNNEIGLPLTLLECPADTHIIVLELGMNHPGEIRRLSKIAEPLTCLITNIGYAHIGQLGSLDSIADAKAEVFDGLNHHGYAFLNADDPYFEYLKNICPAEVIPFQISDLKILEDQNLNGYELSFHGHTFHYPLAGKHNLSNLSAALKMAEFYQVDPAAISSALEMINPVSGRSEVIRQKLTIINDCYNANPSSMQAGLLLLAGIKGRRIAVLSDMLELGIHSRELHTQMGRFIAENQAANAVFAYGNESRFMIEEAKEKTECFWFETKEKMIESLLSFVKSGDTILVKASRGMKLEDAVQALKSKF